jgi:hypothetical protein
MQDARWGMDKDGEAGTEGKKAGDRVWGRTPEAQTSRGSRDYLQVFTSIKPRSSYTSLQSSPNIFPHRGDERPSSVYLVLPITALRDSRTSHTSRSQWLNNLIPAPSHSLVSQIMLAAPSL